MTDALHLNIVSLDVPFPPDYGGAIDIFYRIKALHAQGVAIYLHCFRSIREARQELLAYCKEVHYYRRKTGLRSHLSLLPYITYSRRSNELIERLAANTHPILLEGLHCTHVLFAEKLHGRKFFLRSHNIEHDYYRYLARREGNILRRLYFYKESFLLRRLLKRLPADLLVGAISPADTQELRGRFKNVFWLPPFHSADQVQSLTGSGRYALYHGNLSVSENAEIAEQLITAFTEKSIRLIVAGKGIGEAIKHHVASSINIEIVADPGRGEMDNLIRNAHVILLPTHQPTGIKLKLIESLYRGRFCVANAAMVAGTHLEDLVVPTEDDFYGVTKKLMCVSYTHEHTTNRRAALNGHYNNAKNAQQLMRQLVIPSETQT